MNHTKASIREAVAVGELEAGMEKTILSFKGQTEGAEGLKITNGENITLEGFTVVDTKGDAIKVQSVDKLTFRNVKTDWSGRPKKSNGSYGFYPVQCKNVLLEDCIARGASDAGIYVGQSREVTVRRCEACMVRLAHGAELGFQAGRLGGSKAERVRCALLIQPQHSGCGSSRAEASRRPRLVETVLTSNLRSLT